MTSPKSDEGGLPKIGAPATRALHAAGVAKVSDLTRWTKDELGALHGMGPKAIRILEEHLGARGLGFKSE
jgi:predicted flap endonuclease-1-like 5' DNA nuclease